MPGVAANVEPTDDGDGSIRAIAPFGQDISTDQGVQQSIPGRGVSTGPVSPILPPFPNQQSLLFRQNLPRSLSPSGSSYATASEGEAQPLSDITDGFDSDINAAGDVDNGTPVPGTTRTVPHPGIISFIHLSGLADSAAHLSKNPAFTWPATDVDNYLADRASQSIWDCSLRGLYQSGGNSSINASQVHTYSDSAASLVDSTHPLIAGSTDVVEKQAPVSSDPFLDSPGSPLLLSTAVTVGTTTASRSSRHDEHAESCRIATAHALAMLQRICGDDYRLKIDDIRALIQVPDLEQGQISSSTHPDERSSLDTRQTSAFDAVKPPPVPINTPRTLITRPAEKVQRKRKRTAPVDAPTSSPKRQRQQPPTRPLPFIDPSLEPTLTHAVQIIDPLYWSTTALILTLSSSHSIDLARLKGVANPRVRSQLGKFINHIRATAIDGFALLLYTDGHSMHQAGITEPVDQEILGKLIVRFRRRSSGYRCFCRSRNLRESLCAKHLRHLGEGTVREWSCRTCGRSETLALTL